MQADKKKLLAVGALAVVVLCVGVFEFAGGGSQEPAPTKKPAGHAKAGASLVPGQNPAATSPDGKGSSQVVAANDGKGDKLAITQSDVTTERDPFDGSKFQQLPPKQTGPITPSKVMPAPAPLPLQGRLGIAPVQPDIAGSKLPNPGAGLPVAARAADPNAFNYSVSGVITGDRPAAVFADAQGNQRLIQLGTSLDPDTKVVAISRGRVTVRHHGKDMTLTVGAGNPTEKRSDEK